MPKPARISTDHLLALAEDNMFGLGNNGICLACGAEAMGVEDDARGHECEECGESQVYGAGEALLMGAGS